MFLVAGGESKRIVLGEVLPNNIDQEQDLAQDVAAQWVQENIKEIRSEIKKTSNEFYVATSRARMKSIEISPKNKNNSVEYSCKQRQLCMEQLTMSDCQKLRKVIPVDFDLKLDEDDELDEDDVIYSEFRNKGFVKDLNATTSSQRIISASSNYINLKPNDYTSRQLTIPQGFKLTKHDYHQFCDSQLESYDLATQCPLRNSSARRHTTNKCILPYLSIEHSCLPSLISQDSERLPTSTNNTLEFNSFRSQNFNLKLPFNKKPVPKPRNNFEERKLNFAKGIDCAKGAITQKNLDSKLEKTFLEDRLSLTLEEIVHIRSVLTKAELESLPTEGRVKEDVEKRRVCFLCLKTRFGLLGPWGQRCKLCEKTVCVKCYSKMRIPADHFAHVPVLLLSPGLLLSPSTLDSEPETLENSWSKCRNTVDSAPVSPAMKRFNSEIKSDTLENIHNHTLGEHVLSTVFNNVLRDNSSSFAKRPIHRPFGSPAKLYNTTTFGTLRRKTADNGRDMERIHGVLMVVCHDCRIMVIQIIKNSRLTRANIRNNVISRLTLNLSPVYV